MTRDKWPMILERFRFIAATKGIYKVSPDIPASAKTVYRMLAGETRRPSLAVKAGVKRIVDDESRIPRKGEQ